MRARVKPYACASFRRPPATLPATPRPKTGAATRARSTRSVHSLGSVRSEPRKFDTACASATTAETAATNTSAAMTNSCVYTAANLCRRIPRDERRVYRDSAPPHRCSSSQLADGELDQKKGRAPQSATTYRKKNVSKCVSGPAVQQRVNPARRTKSPPEDPQQEPTPLWRRPCTAGPPAGVRIDDALCISQALAPPTQSELNARLDRRAPPHRESAA